MVKKIMVVILCVCMLFNFAAQPVHAMGAEGIIIGGAAAAGVTLTVGQVALIAAAAFGLVYAVTHADEIGAMLENALSAAANNDETRQQQLTNWRTGAFGGVIALATAPAWIKGVIQNWVGDLYESTEVVPIHCGEYAANTPIPDNMFWTDLTVTLPVATTVIRAGSINSSGAYYNVSYRMIAIANTTFEGAKTYTINGIRYYLLIKSSSTAIPNNSELAGNNKLTYDSVSSLPDYDYIKSNYTGSDWAHKMLTAWASGYFDDVATGSICPDVTVGGVEGAMNDFGIDSINMPDINVGQSDLLVPDNTASINDTLNDVLSRLEQQELTWQQYMDDVAVGTPTVSVPAEGTEAGTLDYPLTDTGVSDTPIDTTQPDNPSTTIPEGIEPYTIDLRDFFPFCIPFDIVKLVNTLCAEPEAPCFTWGIATPDGGTEEIEVDLAIFDPVAEILRGMELLLFIIGLAFLTRALIRG